MSAILGYLHTQAPSRSVARMIFILTFMKTVDLRSAELLSAKLGDVGFEKEGLVLKIQGKGYRLRTIFVPQPAFEALQNYLHERCQNSIETATPEAPLLSSTSDANIGIGYQPLYATVKIWLQKAISASPLTARECADLAGASTH
jgi:site-specific recombinase XerD